MHLEITGVAETAAALRALPDKIQNRCMKKALQAGAQITLNAAISKVPRKTGKTAACISVQTTGSGHKLLVSVMCDQEWPFVGRFLEGGTLNHFGMFGGRILAAKDKYNRKKRLFTSGRTEQRMAPHPWMRPAFEITANAAMQVILDSLKQDVENIAENK